VTVYKVQDCGCIALPEDVQRQTGLFPGATFELEAAADGLSMKLSVIERAGPPGYISGAVCGASPEESYPLRPV
jgi:hypothetical protein